MAFAKYFTVNKFIFVPLYLAIIVGIKERDNFDVRDAPIFLVFCREVFKALIVELTKVI